MLGLPNLSSYERQGIRKGGRVLGVPGRLTDGQLLAFADWWAKRVTSENKPNKVGVVRAMAASDH